MGNQSSQLEKPDYLDQSEHTAQANYIRGASDNSQLDDTDSQPYHLNPSRFAFSSQAPQSTDPLAQLQHPRNLRPNPKPNVDTASDNRSSPASPKSPVLKFEAVESPRDSSEHSWTRQSRRPSKRKRQSENNSSPPLDTGTKMYSFTTQAHDFGSPSLGANSQGEQLDQADQQDALDNLPAPSSQKAAKRARKERKKRKSQMEEAQTFEDDLNYSHYPPIENLKYSLPGDHGITPQDFEAPKSSKKRKRKSKHRETIQDLNHPDNYGYEVEPSFNQSFAQVAEPIAPTLTNDPANCIDPLLTGGAPSQKRKSKDQGKKGHKKQRRGHVGLDDAQNGLDGIGQESLQYNVDQGMDDIEEETMEEPTRRLEKGVVADIDVSPSGEHSFGDLAQSIYADHVRSRNSQPDYPGDASPENNSNGASGAASDLSHDEGFDENFDGYSDNIKADHDQEDSDSEAYKVDEVVNSPEASNDEYFDSGVAKYEARTDSSSAQDFDQHSDDLGLGNTVGLADTDGNDIFSGYEHISERASSNSGSNNQIEVPSSVLAQNDGLPAIDPTEHAYAKSKNGQKRTSKSNVYGHVVEENVAELPSPAAAAASRKRKGKELGFKRPNRKGSETIAGPSSDAPKGQTTQPKITSMLEGGSSASNKPATPASSSQKPAKTTGIFSQFELRNINEAVQRWQENHKLTDYERNELIQGNPREVNSTDFWDSVHATCPNRIRQKVINQCRRKYHNFVARGTWSEEQNEELARMYDLHGTKYTVIGKLINRHPEDVRDRIRNYIICGQNMRRHAWSREEESRLTDIVNEAINHVKELQRTGNCPVDSRPDDLVDWQLVSEKMNHTRSRLQCSNKWKLIKSQLEGRSIDGGDVLTVDELIDKARQEAEAMRHRERYNLAKAILACGANAESRIPWAKIRSERPGYTSTGKKLSRPTLMVAWHRMKLTVGDWRTFSVPETAQQLCSQYKRTKTLDYASLDPAQLNAEYQDMEHKFGKLLKSPGTNKALNIKTPHFAVKTDDEESAAGDAESAEEGTRQDRGGSMDLGFDAEIIKDDSNEASEDEVEEVEDSEPEVKPQKSNKGRGSTQVTESSGSNDVTTPNHKSGRATEEEGTPANSAKKILARRKGSRARRPQPPADTVESDEQSSDTNASEVESIPARRPE